MSKPDQKSIGIQVYSSFDDHSINLNEILKKILGEICLNENLTLPTGKGDIDTIMNA